MSAPRDDELIQRLSNTLPGIETRPADLSRIRRSIRRRRHVRWGGGAAALATVAIVVFSLLATASDDGRETILPPATEAPTPSASTSPTTMPSVGNDLLLPATTTGVPTANVYYRLEGTQFVPVRTISARPGYIVLKSVISYSGRYIYQAQRKYSGNPQIDKNAPLELVRTDLDGNNLQPIPIPLPPGLVTDGSVDPSPDDSEFAFVATAEAGSSFTGSMIALYTIGAPSVRLIEPMHDIAGWMPDGSLIVTSIDTTRTESGPLEIGRIDEAGSYRKIATLTPPDSCTSYGSAGVDREGDIAVGASRPSSATPCVPKQFILFVDPDTGAVSPGPSPDPAALGMPGAVTDLVGPYAPFGDGFLVTLRSKACAGRFARLDRTGFYRIDAPAAFTC